MASDPSVVVRPSDGNSETLALWMWQTLQRCAGDQSVAIRGYDSTARPTVEISWDQLSTGARSLAKGLGTFGIGRGDRCAILAGNCPEFLLAQAGTWMAGAAQTLLNPRLHDSELICLLQDSRPEVVYLGPGQVERGSAVVSGSGIGAKVVSLRERSESVDHIECLQRFGLLEEPPDVDGAAPASVAYTGGTTGTPKGVVLSHRAVLRSVETLALIFGLWQRPFLHAAPLVHGTLLCAMPCYASGSYQAVMETFNPGAFLSLTSGSQIEATLLAPSMLYMIQDELSAWEREHSRWDGSLNRILYGGSAMNAERARELIGRFGNIFHQFYGQGECPMVISTLSPGDHDDVRLRSAGRPTWLCEVTIVDDDGGVVKHGEWGEITVRSPLVMEGYWNRPDETAEAFRGGRLHTGDIGFQDEDGFLYVVDRKKDMIITGGMNVFSAEVERVLVRGPGVAQACVVGRADDRWGEAIHALIVPSEGANPSPDELTEFAREHLAGYKVPKSWSIADLIPLTPLGKYDRKAIRQALGGS